MHRSKPIRLGCSHFLHAVPHWPDAGNTARVVAACFHAQQQDRHVTMSSHAINVSFTSTNMRRQASSINLVWCKAAFFAAAGDNHGQVAVSGTHCVMFIMSCMRLTITQAAVNFVAAPEKVEKEAALSPNRAAPVMATMRATISRTAPTCSSSGRHAHSTLAMGPILGSKDLQVNAA